MGRGHWICLWLCLMVIPARPLECDDSGILGIDCQSGGHSSAAHSFLLLSGESAVLQHWNVHLGLV